MKTLNEKLAVLAEWMGVDNIDNWEPHKKFDDIWPVWVRFRDWPGWGGLERNDAILERYKDSIEKALTSSDTPAPAFELLVEGVEWLQSIK